jgi:hypothetical protein
LKTEENAKRIFILRNNDLGDVLLATPLAEGLRKAFPNAYISMGVGDWARPLLENNPTLDEIISINAPWHNKQNCRFQANSPRTFLKGLVEALYIEVMPENQARYGRSANAPLAYLDSHGYELYLCKEEDFEVFGNSPHETSLEQGSLLLSRFRAEEYPGNFATDALALAPA